VPKAAGGRGEPPAQVRIIGGRWKRTLLPVPTVEGLRPTPDRVRETLFNWLGQDLEGWACVDPFAGTGALGFEAASRGAARVVMVERDPRAVELLERTRDRLKAESVQVVRGEALAWLRMAAGQGPRFDLVLLDPPFGQQWPERVLPLLEPLLSPEARVYLETEAPLQAGAGLLAASPNLELLRSAKAGRVHYHLLRHRNGS
jgi:16S rRNA (guanine966-N2)-methyltransferase